MRIARTMALMCVVLMAAEVAFAQASKAAYVIAGVVVDDRTGQPLANASVSIALTTAQDQSVKFVTGANGAFRFEGLAKGKYSLMARRRGYPLQSFDQHENYSSAIAVADDQETTKIVFRLHPDASIQGKIVDEANDAAPQVQVWLFSTRNDLGRRSTRVVNQTMTDDTGEYAFRHLEAGTYYVMAMGRPWYAA